MTRRILCAALVPFLSCSHPAQSPTRPIAPAATQVNGPNPMTGTALYRTEAVGISSSPDSLRAFMPLLEPTDQGGECSILHPNGAGTTIVAASFPSRANAATIVSLTFGANGEFVRYGEQRGVVRTQTPPSFTPAQRDSARAAAMSLARATNISLDYPGDRGLVINHNGDVKPQGITGPVATIAALPQLGVMQRLERVRKLCGV